MTISFVQIAMLFSFIGNFHNYMNLHNHPGPSGVPLGSIGTGYFSIAPEGNINRAALNDTFTQHIIKDINSSFFAVYEYNFGTNVKAACRMVRDNKEYCSMRGYEHTFYRGLYPFVGISFGKTELLPETRVALEAFSPIIPHNLKDSSLPVAFFEVHLKNPSNTRKSISIAFSWEDLLGRHMFEDESFFEQVKENTYWAFNPQNFGYRKRIETFAKSWENQDLKGIDISIKNNIQPRKDTFQNYTNRLLVLGEKQSDLEISMLSSYEIENADELWKSFRENGNFPENQFEEKVLFEPSQNNEKAVAVCINTNLDGGEKRILRFMLVWYIPKLDTDRPNRHPFATILECFEPNITISRLGVNKPGKASSEIKFINIKSFNIKKGLQIEFSEYWDELVFYPEQPCILDEPGQVLLRTVENKYRKRRFQNDVSTFTRV